MGNPYTQPTLSGYDSDPPPDDGSEVASNLAEWSTLKSELTDPIKTFMQAVDSNANTAFGKIFGANITTQSGDYTVVAGDQGKFIEVDAAATITLIPVATAGTGFAIAIVNTHASASVTVDGNGSETVNGSTTKTLLAGDGCILTCNGTEWIGVFGSLIVAASDTEAGKIEIAVQSEMEAGSSTTLAVTPGRVHFHPAVAKAWVNFDMAASKDQEYNAGTIDDDGTGEFGFNFTTGFAAATYAAFSTLITTGATDRMTNLDTRATGSIDVTVVSSSTGSAAETGVTDVSVICFGDFA